jgi:hypothetical protein
MSSRVRKTTPKSIAPHPKTVDRDQLLAAMFDSSVPVKHPCSYCEDHKLPCEASPSDSSRCLECVAHNQSLCDAQGVSVQHLRKIASNFRRLETEMEEAEDELAVVAAKVKRLRQQKRKWSEKMIRAVSRGVTSVEELEELERQEAEEARRQEAEGTAAQAAVPPTTDPVPDEPLLDPSWIQRFVIRPFFPHRFLTYYLVLPSSISPLGSTGLRYLPWSIRVPLVELLKSLGAVEICSWLP